ncbi:acyltransferase family protein [candidate division CSSED10-310 bacterium]|uniref:Acyltransferase family protein n=1 Tax=candidate division CSSED10-310 bacterium TaxID=2855610 RepID=A0ABV6YUP8_UNCC1
MIEKATTSSADNWQRRYDIDWLRTMAMGLLIIFHVVVSFQPWAHTILIIQNEHSLKELWIIISMINIWRIPILFMISGMGVRFAMERRDWKQLLKDRTVRILLPFLFGFFFICPISIYLGMKYYGKQAAYIPNAGHLWFLVNIFLYVLCLLPLLVYLKHHPDNIVLRLLSRMFRHPGALYSAALAIMVEVWLLDPNYFTYYIQTPHGFWLGMVCFAVGFIFISLQDVFWQAVEGVRRSALALAFLFYMVRLVVFKLQVVPNTMIAFESMCWMLAILGYGSLYLNKPSHSLNYFSKAVYPVYIIHLPVQFCISYFLLPQPLPVILKLIFLLAGTFSVSLLMYHYVIRRLKWIRPMFGMKLSYS